MDKRKAVAAARETFDEAWEAYVRPVDHEYADAMYAWLVENGFFESPCSTRYHCAYAGGLLVHSVNVWRRLREGAVPAGYSERTCAVCGLLHDVCKVGAYVRDGDGYRWDKAHSNRHGDLSRQIVSRYLPLSRDEGEAIEWHMGEFDARGAARYEEHARRSRLVRLIHEADERATHVDDLA